MTDSRIELDPEQCFESFRDLETGHVKVCGGCSTSFSCKMADVVANRLEELLSANDPSGRNVSVIGLRFLEESKGIH